MEKKNSTQRNEYLFKNTKSTRKIKKKKINKSHIFNQKDLTMTRKEQMSNLKHFVNVLTNHKKSSQYHIEDKNPFESNKQGEKVWKTRISKSILFY